MRVVGAYPPLRARAPRNRDRTTLAALAEAMFRGGPRPLSKARIEEHVNAVLGMWRRAPPMTRLGFRVGLFILWLSPMLLFVRARPLPSLSIDERTDVLRRLERSRNTNLVLVFTGIRAVMTMLFYEAPGELELTEVPPQRTRHARHLSLLGPVPVPQESGVRLKGEASDVDEVDEESVA